MRKEKILTYRYEPFGGILHLSRPASLVWVDKDYMRSLGYQGSPLWDLNTGLLSAPTEVHLSVTRQCSAGCTSCYMASYQPGTRPDLEARELGLNGMKRIVDTLASARVFHLALGGGESLEMPWFFELVDHVRKQGIIPNLTTNGYLIDEHNARACRHFGQVNVSVDETGPSYHAARGADGFDAADRAITLLKRAGCHTGMNVVVSRQNVHRLDSILRYAKKKGVNQVELLRFKPAGRGKDMFHEMDLTPDQARTFYPRIKSLVRRLRLRIRLDCSFMPMVFAHGPNFRSAERFALSGCLGGEMLMGVGPGGEVHACSFSRPEALELDAFRQWWPASGTFVPFRSWHEKAMEPCVSCRYLDLCRGGCHVVAHAVKGSMAAPDPGCPIVRQDLPLLH